MKSRHGLIIGFQAILGNVKTWVILICLMLASSCVEQVKQRVGALLGESSETTEAVSEEFKPIPPPSLEQDKIVQVSPKEKLISLFEQFNRSPDDTLKGLVLAEFVNNKGLFSQTLDPQLVNALNRSVPNVQQGDAVTIHFLTQLYSHVVGDNKEHLRSVLARAFDSAPNILSDYMARMGEDKLCIIVGIVPPEVSPESKRDFLMTRWQDLTALKQSNGTSPAGLLYVDACLRTLNLALNPSGEPTVAPESAPVPVPAEASPPATTIDNSAPPATEAIVPAPAPAPATP